MKKLRLVIASLMTTTSFAVATTPTIYPTPQKVTIDNSTIELKAGTTQWLGESHADPTAVALVKQIIGNKNIKVIIGEANDPGMDKYLQVPKAKEAYYLKVSNREIILVGRDQSGTFYGAQTLRQLISKNGTSLPKIEVLDYPDVPFRGTVEGFYGKPWGHQDRIEQMKFYGKYKLNTYIYGPKNDPFHGFSSRWREPYPADKAEMMRELVKVSKENKVNFVWAVHPGRDIKWNDQDNDGTIDDFVNCLNKFELMYELGVRSFAVFFDDISGEGAKPQMQAKILNYLNREFVRKKGDVTPLIMCPTQYNRAWSGGDYLDILGTKMDRDIDIMWTGDSVCRDITRSGQDWINKRIKRKAYIWWNWPVSDYCRTQLLIGRTYGLDKKNKDTYAGLTSNPMDKPEASKIGLFGVANYCWNIQDFDSHKSWRDGIKILFPNVAEEMQTFANHNSDQGKNFHGYRREESVEFKPVIDKALKEFKAEQTLTKATYSKLITEFSKIEKSGTVLLKSLKTTHPALHLEIEHWLEAFTALGQAGTIASKLIGPSTTDASQQLKLVNDLNNAFKAMEEAGIRQKEKGMPDRWAKECKVATLVVTPFLQKIFADSSRSIYKNLTGKELSNSAKNLFKAFSNSAGLKNIEAERKGKYVNTKRILEIVKLKPNEFIGLELPPGIFANYVHLKLNNKNAGTSGEIQISKNGKVWKKINSSNNGEELQSRLNPKDKIRFMRYINTSGKVLEIKLNLFKLDIPENAKANSSDAMFDGDFSSFYQTPEEGLTLNPPKGKKASKVYIIGSVEDVIIIYKNGKSVPYNKQRKNNKSAIKSLKIKAKSNASINEVIWQ